MKIKSYSLIEILLASMIFMVVIFMVVSSFGMIKKSNENTSDLANTTECARQIENIATSIFKSASYHQPRIMPVVFNNESYRLGEELSADNPVQAVGFAVFEKSSKEGKIIVSVIVKEIDADSGASGYYHDTTEMFESSIKGGATIGLNAPDNGFKLQPIHSNECRALMVNETYEGFEGNYDKPFEIRLNSPYSKGPSSLLGGSAYSLKLNDMIFTKYSDQTQNDKTASRLYFETINNIGAI